MNLGCFEKPTVKDGLNTSNMITTQDKLSWNPSWQIRRFESKKDWKDAMRAKKNGESIILYEESEAKDLFGIGQTTQIQGNLLLNEGITELLTIMSSSSGTEFDNANSYIGVGDSDTAEAATQTDLQAVTNKLYVVMDATYPSVTSQTITYRSTFASAQANYDWNEFTIANGSSGSAVNLCRKVSSQGEKQSGQIWEISYTITLS